MTTSPLDRALECFRRGNSGGEGRARGQRSGGKARSPGWNASRGTPDAVHSSPPAPRRAALAPTVHPPETLQSLVYNHQPSGRPRRELRFTLSTGAARGRRPRGPWDLAPPPIPCPFSRRVNVRRGAPRVILSFVAVVSQRAGSRCFRTLFISISTRLPGARGAGGAPRQPVRLRGRELRGPPAQEPSPHLR